MAPKDERPPVFTQPGVVGGRSAVPIIATLICGLILLFLFAATIVLSLIPLYLPQKQAAANPSKTQSNAAQLLVNTGNNNGRRRQTSGGSPLANYTGGILDATGVNSIQSQLTAIATLNNQVDHVVVRKVTVARTTGIAGEVINLLVEYYVVYRPRCISVSCQTAAGASARSFFMSRTSTPTLSLTNFAILNPSNGAVVATINNPVPINGILWAGALGHRSQTGGAFPYTTVTPIVGRRR